MLFNANIDFSSIDVYNVKAYPTLANDKVKNNDTLFTFLEHTDLLALPSNLLPANGTTNVQMPVNFSWSSVASPYMISLFGKATDNMPLSRVVADLAQINLSYENSSLLYGSAHKWKSLKRTMPANRKAT